MGNFKVRQTDVYVSSYEPLKSKGKSTFKNKFQKEQKTEYARTSKKFSAFTNLKKLEKKILKNQFEKVAKEVSSKARVLYEIVNNKNLGTEDFYRIMACDGAYANWEIGDTIPQPNEFLGSYKIQKIIENQRGLKIFILTPEKKGNPPIFCCKGSTCTANILDDFNKEIGRYGFLASQDEIQEALLQLSEEFGPAVILGHSLGGALAQIIGSEFCDLLIENEGEKQTIIKDIYHFNSPGVGKRAARQFLKKQDKLHQIGIDPPKVVRVRHANDLISLIGGAHLPANEYVKLGNINLFGNPLKIQAISHKLRTPIDEGVRQKKYKKSLTQKAIFKILETGRTTIGALSKEILLQKMQKEYEIREIADRCYEIAKKAMNP